MKHKLKHLLSHPPIFFGSTSLCHSQLLYLLPLDWCQLMGNGGCSQCITAPLFCFFLLTLFPCFSVDSPEAAVLQGLQCGLSMGLSMDICSAACSTSSSSFFTAPRVAWLFLTHFFFPNPSLPTVTQGFYPFSNTLSLRHHHLGCGSQRALWWVS